ncbi:efflux RND transporter periplasmic adaptor subunit [Vibrio sinensis]|uniref:Efflux RND transporter periplasmic adaptor subunit n=1 Tax=Vibrio sinensis TaxID=2302434 RepID=A0A3A6QWU6_9VIBR|nr:efflux RND transporter periplasmic adaptor subunit [Vibrio sinensis]RJX75748.1 efflux RND transporter periplasmic adaptor subunit [Vibrio sinensis]
MKRTLLITALSSSLFLVGCGEKEESQQDVAIPLVIAKQVTTTSHHQSKSYIGRVQAVEDTTILAQVSGYLKSREFEEGQMVEKGQLLYTIEPSSFQAQLASARASIAQANADLKKAQLDFERGKTLLPQGSISQSEFDALTANLLGSEAQVKAANAQFKLAEVNLSYTQIRAPFSGRISESMVSIGDLVSPQSGILTTIVSLDPVHTSFSVSERERLELGMDRVHGDADSEANAVEVRVILENGQVFEQLGELDYLGNRIDVNTGTIAMRAVVPNPEHRLLPGQHIRVELREKEQHDVIVVPRKAVQTDLEGHFVMVAVSDGMIEQEYVAERHNVTLGPQLDQGVIVTSGLDRQDTIITQGLQRVRNGVSVRIDSPATENHKGG